MAIYKKVTDLVGNTPILELGNYEEKNQLEATILAKLEYFNPAGSVKDRIAREIIRCVRDRETDKRFRYH